MTASPEHVDADDEPGDEPTDGAASGEPSKEGRRTRRRLARLLEEEEVITGDMDLIVADDQPLRHRLVLRGKYLTSAGGPAREVLDLVGRVYSAIHAIMPFSQPWLASVAGGNSIEVQFEPPPEEVDEARRRAGAELGDIELGERLPDTTLGVLVLASILQYEEPEDAVDLVKRVSVSAMEEIRDLVVTLADEQIALDMDDVLPGARAEAGWSLEVVERLDAAAEIPPVTVSVLGVLQGANSGGEGSFELVTDPNQPLDPALGRRRPGSKIKGTLTPQARRQIREHNLWDKHVHARLQVVRQRRIGGSVRVHSVRMMSVEGRF